MNDMATEQSISLTPAALAQTKQYYASSSDYADKKLRLYLEGKGCDGFFYGVTFDVPTKEDIVFSQSEGVEVIVDDKTLPFVKGATIDWVDDERGQGYLVENPNHRKFRGKFFKRPSWQKQSGASQSSS